MAIFPAEGQLVHVSKAEAERIIDAAFAGKTPPPGHGVASVLHGAPGSGKTTFGWDYHTGDPENLENQIFVAYDEHGALYAIDAYREGLKDAHSFKQRHALWDTFRADSQYIRTQIIERAISGGFDILADVTSSGGGAPKFIQALQAQDYSVSLHSVYAPFNDCAPRFLGRERPGSPEELITKRIGALQTLPLVAAAADNTYLHFNPDYAASLKTLFGPAAQARATCVALVEASGCKSIEAPFAMAAMLHDMVQHPQVLNHTAITGNRGELYGYEVAHSDFSERTFVPVTEARAAELADASRNAAAWIASTFGAPRL